MRKLYGYYNQEVRGKLLVHYHSGVKESHELKKIKEVTEGKSRLKVNTGNAVFLVFRSSILQIINLWRFKKLKKLTSFFIVFLVVTVLLGFGVKGAQADSLLFPYLSTQTGVFSFVTLVNDGLSEYATITGYNFIYGHKTAPIANRKACNHYDGTVSTTPADMMTFEVGGRVLDATSEVLFENAAPATSTTLPLNVANQIAFLVTEPLGVAEVEDDVVRNWGYAEVIDTTNNLSLAYSTQNFVADVTGKNFENVGSTWSALAWYPTTYVTTSWHVLPLGTALTMSPPGGGGIRAAYFPWDGVVANAGAYNRDEKHFSGASRVGVRCMGSLTRENFLQAGALSSTAGGGWAYFGPSDVAITFPLTDADDPSGVAYNPAPASLIHKIQQATTAAGVGARITINREPQFSIYPFAP